MKAAFKKPYLVPLINLKIFAPEPSKLCRY